MSAGRGGKLAALSIVLIIGAVVAIVIGLVSQPVKVITRTGGGPLVMADDRTKPSERISSVAEELKISGIYDRDYAELKTDRINVESAPMGGDDTLIGEIEFDGQTVYMRRPPGELVQRVVDPTKEDGEHVLALAFAHIQIGQEPQANRLMRDYAQNNSDDPDSWRVLADYWLRRARLDERVEALEKEYGLLTELYSQAKDKSESERLKNKILSVNRTIMGDLRKGLLEDDLRKYRLRVLDIFPDDSKLFFEYVTELQDSDEPKQVLRALDLYGERFPEEMSRRLEARAWAWEQLGKPERVREIYEEATTPLTEDNEPLFQDLLRRLSQDGEINVYRRDLETELEARFDLQVLWRLTLVMDYLGRSWEMRDVIRKQADRFKQSSPTPEELFTFATLCRRAGLGDKATLYFYNLTLVAKGDLLDRSRAELVSSLNGSGMRLPLPGNTGAGAVSMAPFMSTNPGILGGLLSLGLNTSGVESAFTSLSRVGQRSSNRDLALALIDQAMSDNPDSEQVPDLVRTAVSIYRNLGQYDRALTWIGRFTGNRPGDDHVPEFLFLKADVGRAAKRKDVERQAYEELLRICSERGLDRQYLRALDRYIGRLIAWKEYDEVLALYWAELDRRPDDRELYDEFLEFLSRFKLYEEEGKVYRRAIKEFSDTNWYHKLARWTIRHRGDAAFHTLTEHVVKIFSDDDLYRYLTSFVSSPGPRRYYSAEARFFERMHLQAIERYPYDMRFVRRLLNFYRARGFGSYNDPKAREEYFKLAQRYALLDEGIRKDLITRLAGQKRLSPILEQLKQAGELNPAEALMLAECLCFDSRFEYAYAVFDALEKVYQGDREIAGRLAELGRSLDFSYYVQSPQLSESTAKAYLNLQRIEPGQSSYATQAGEVLIEIGKPRRALETWESIITPFPGDRQRYLELATLYWDYYFFPNAAGVLLQARDRLDDDYLYGAQLAAIYESMGDRDSAIDEYVKLVLAAADQHWQAEERLAYLERRHKLTSRIDAEFMAQIDASGDDAQPARRYGNYLGHRGRSAERTAFYRNMLDRYDSTLFLEDALYYFQAQGLGGDVEAALIRLVEVKGRDNQSLTRLALHYENEKDFLKAEGLYKEMADREPEGSDDRREQQHVLAAFYMRTDRPSDAIAVYKKIVAEVPEDKKAVLDSARFSLAEKLIEVKRPKEAEPILWKLIESNPLRQHYYNTLSRVYTSPGNEDYEGLVKLYSFSIDAVKKSTLNRHEKKWRIASSRRGLIDALTKLGRYHEAVDQYIEIVNRQPLSEGVVLEAFEYAHEHGLSARMIDYYTRTSETSHKDYRWNVVLGDIFYQQRNFPAAEQQFEKAIHNEPHRSWLQVKLAQVYIQTEQWDEAAARYRRASELEGGEKSYIETIARMYFRAGRTDDAVSTLLELTRGEDVPVWRRFQVARQLQQWEQGAEASKALGEAVSALLADPYDHVLRMDDAELILDIYSTEQGYLGAFREARWIIDRLDAESRKPRNFGRDKPVSSMHTMQRALSGSFAQAIREQGGADARAEVAGALESEVLDACGHFALSSGGAKLLNEQTKFPLDMARAIGLPDLEEQILVRRAQLMAPLIQDTKGKSYAYRSLEDLRDLYGSRGDRDGELRVTERGFKESDGKLWNYTDIAFAAYWAGDASSEMRALRDNLCKYNRRRIVRDLSVSRGYVRRAFFKIAQDPVELDELLAGDCAGAYYLNLLLELKDRERAVAFLGRSGFFPKNRLWIDAKRALIALHFGEVSDEAENAFKRVLDLPAEIGRRSVAEADRSSSLYDNEWFAFAPNYGMYLKAKDADSDYVSFLVAYSESEPRNARSYLSIGDALVKLDQPLKALEYYDLGLGLRPRYFELIDHKAQALLQGGRKEEALETWKLLIPAGCDAYAFLAYMNALGAQGLWDDAFGVVEEGIISVFADIYSYDKFSVLNQVLQAHETNGRSERSESFVKACITRVEPDISLLEDLIKDDLIGVDYKNEMWRRLLERIDDPTSESIWYRVQKLEEYMAFCTEHKCWEDGTWAADRMVAIDSDREKSQGHAELIIRLAVACGRIADAQQIVDQRITDNPTRGNYEWAERVWKNLDLEEQYEKARGRTLEYLVDHKDANWSEKLEYAGLLGNRGMADRAAALIEGVVFQNSENIDVLRTAALKCFELRLMDRCGELISRIEAISPGDLETIELKVRYLHHRIGLDPAHQELLVLLGRPDCDSGVLDRLDKGYLEDLRGSGGLSSEAVWLGEQANLPAWGEILLARIQIERGDTSAAAERLEKTKVEFPEVHYPLLALAHEKAGNNGGARKALLNALRYEPGDRPLMLRLLQVELADGKDLDACYWLNKLRYPLEIYPEVNPLFSPSAYDLRNDLAGLELKPEELDALAPEVVDLLERQGCLAHAERLARVSSKITDNAGLASRLKALADELEKRIDVVRKEREDRLVIVRNVTNQGGDR